MVNISAFKSHAIASHFVFQFYGVWLPYLLEPSNLTSGDRRKWRRLHCKR